jgi:hypothetical protein
MTVRCSLQTLQKIAYGLATNLTNPMPDLGIKVVPVGFCADRFAAATQPIPRALWSGFNRRPAIVDQATPGLQVHQSGKPFDDPRATSAGMVGAKRL